MINWKVRFKSKTFWMTLIPAVLVLIQVVAAVFGVRFDFSDLQGKLLAVVDAVFVLLAILGIVTDHTTAGIADSERALGYDAPYEKEEVARDE
jgi:phi LC3 family holin